MHPFRRSFAAPSRAVRSLYLCMLGLLAAVWLSPAFANSLSSQQDDNALRDLAALSDHVWNERNARALADLYAKDASLTIALRGIEVSGRESIYAYFSNSLSRMPANVRHRTEIKRIVWLTNDQAMADTKVTLLRFDEQRETVIGEFFTMVLIGRTAGGYEFQAVRAVPVPHAKAEGSGNAKAG